MRVLFKISTALLWALCLLGSSQAQLTFSGYSEHEVDQLKTSASFYSGYNKFRLDMEQHPDDRVGIYATLEAKRYFGKTQWLLSEFLPVSPPFDTTFVMEDSLTAEYLYTVLEYDRFMVTVGKQPLSIGTGYIWNPTDIFNRKDMLDPTYELSGVSALRIQYSGRGGDLDFIAQPFRDGRSVTAYLSGTTQLQHFELTGLIARRTFQTSGAVEAFDGYGGSAVGELFGLGVWAEFLSNRTGNSGAFKSEWTVGLDYTFESSFYWMIERYHNDRGGLYSSAAGYSPVGVFDYLGGFNRALAGDYQFVLLRYPLGDLHSLSLWGIQNLTDDSFVVAPQLSLSLFEDVDADISLYLFEGRDNSEFGTQQFGGRIRLRLYY
ncbi:MAG: hypothetical protein GXO91_00010 [FCB group bacterium]|nr:hypothetical protein [FCB group bacterium]